MSNPHGITLKDLFGDEKERMYPELTQRCKQCDARFDNVQDSADCATRQLISDQQYEAIKEIAKGATVVLQLKSGQTVVGVITDYGFSEKDSHAKQYYVELDDGAFRVSSFLSIDLATEKEVAIWNEKYETKLQPTLKLVQSEETPRHTKHVAEAKNSDDHARVVEELAERMRAPGNVETFAINYSVLRDENEVQRMERTHWKYYMMWLPMNLVALYMMIKVAMYRFLYTPLQSLLFGKMVSKERYLLGPEKGVIVFDTFDRIAHLLRNGVTTSLALDVLYNLRKIRPEPKGIIQAIVNFWLSQPDGNGVRNRAKIVYSHLLKTLRKEIDKSRIEKRSVKVLALACGSAQVDIEAIACLSNNGQLDDIEATFVDLNETSLFMARQLASSRGVEGLIDIKLENIKTFLSSQPDNSWDLVEMVGFLDYRNDESVVSMCREIRRVLKPGGSFITSSICPSFWSFQVRWVINWPFLVRRSKAEFNKLLFSSWSVNDRLESHYVPTKTHVVSVLTKN